MVGFENTRYAAATTTRKISTRHLAGSGSAARDITPSGVIATRRSVISAETSASTVTPATTATSAIDPTHSCSNVNR